MENTITNTRWRVDEVMTIHKQLHEKYPGEFVTLYHRHYTIYKTYNDLKAVNIEGDTFVEQNNMQFGKYADLANTGHKVTWIKPSDGGLEWGLIIDDMVERLI